MSTVKVVNPKHFALTKGKEYDVLSTEGRQVSIVNDNNVTSSYWLSLFAEGKKDKEVAEPEPVVVIPTADVILATLIVSTTEINFTVNGSNYNTLNILGDSGTQISCGIRQISNVNAFIDVITEYIESELEELPAATRNEVVMAIFRKVILAQMQNVTAVGMFLVSTNTNYSEFARIDTILTEFTVASYTRENPNSGNEIKIWVLDQQFDND